MCVKFVSLYWRKKMRVCDNKVLKRIYEPKRDEMKAGWRKLLTPLKYSGEYAQAILTIFDAVIL
jgi:hypothetical protein